MSTRKAAAKSASKPAARRPAAKSVKASAKTTGKASQGKALPRSLSPAFDDPPPRVIRAPAKAPRVPDNAESAQARQLAAAIEKGVADGRLDVISNETAQALMAALCKLYTERVENGSKDTPVEEGQVVSPTGIMVTASGLLRAANLAVFELGMWQSWTGR